MGIYYSAMFMLVLATTMLEDVVAQQAYCWTPCDLDCSQTGPRLCPPESMLTYYDCCPDGCCQYIKWPNLLFLLLIIFLLLSGCCCCAFFLVTDARQRMFLKQQQHDQQIAERMHKKQQQAATQLPLSSNRTAAIGFQHKKQTKSTTIV